MQTKQARLNAKLEKYKIVTKFKADKRNFKTSVSEAWKYTMTKKLTWLVMGVGIADVIFGWVLNIISSPKILDLDSTIVSSHTEFTGHLWIGVVSVLLSYFIRGYMDKNQQINNSQNTNTDVFSVSNIKEQAEEFVTEIKDKISGM